MTFPHLMQDIHLDKRKHIWCFRVNALNTMTVLCFSFLLTSWGCKILEWMIGIVNFLQNVVLFTVFKGRYFYETRTKTTVISLPTGNLKLNLFFSFDAICKWSKIEQLRVFITQHTDTIKQYKTWLTEPVWSDIFGSLNKFNIKPLLCI